MLVFSQAREYLPGTGRFAGEDINKGNIMMPDSLNDYSYCLGNPLILVDKNGRSPVPSPADAQRMMWDYCIDQYHDALDAIKDEWDSRVDAVVEWGKAHEDEIKMGATDATILGAALLAGTGIGLPAGVVVMAIGSTGAIMGEQYYENRDMNGADGFMRGGMNATVIAMGMVTNPTAASLGILCQLSMDMGQESFSSPESYTGSVMGAIIGITDGPAMGAGMATAIGNLLEKLTKNSNINDVEIPVDVVATAFLGWFANVIIQKILPCDLEFFKLSLYQGTLDMMENTVAGITNSAYMNIKELWKCEKTD